MLNADCAPYFQNCPRCGEGSLETLSTHQHCINCNYSDAEKSVPSRDLETLNWAVRAYRDGILNPKKKSSSSQETLQQEFL